MRKFKVWDVNFREMCFDRDLMDEDYLNIVRYNVKPDQHKIMQYTGLKDKNGTEIYEGDIVVFKNWKPKSVVFQTNGVQTFVFDGTDLWLSSYDSEHYKVIGNIYQNLELLG